VNVREIARARTSRARHVRLRARGSWLEGRRGRRLRTRRKSEARVLEWRTSGRSKRRPARGRLRRMSYAPRCGRDPALEAVGIVANRRGPEREAGLRHVVRSASERRADLAASRGSGRRAGAWREGASSTAEAREAYPPDKTTNRAACANGPTPTGNGQKREAEAEVGRRGRAYDEPFPLEPLRATMPTYGRPHRDAGSYEVVGVRAGVGEKECRRVRHPCCQFLRSGGAAGTLARGRV
jgi:hypothetical protein